jgi:hypothetical protein
MDTQVLIVGGGPVGLTLAVDLGRRGVRCILIEKNDAPLGYPKMERCNPRTMEIFRRLGLADTVRAAGYPPDWPMDTYLLFDLMHPPLFKMAHPTVASAKAKRDATLGRCRSNPTKSSRSTRLSRCSSRWRRRFQMPRSNSVMNSNPSRKDPTG